MINKDFFQALDDLEAENRNSDLTFHFFNLLHNHLLCSLSGNTSEIFGRFLERYLNLKFLKFQTEMLRLKISHVTQETEQKLLYLRNNITNLERFFDKSSLWKRNLFIRVSHFVNDSFIRINFNGCFFWIEKSLLKVLKFK